MNFQLWDWASARGQHEPVRLEHVLGDIEPLAEAILGRPLPIQAAPGWGHSDGHTLFLPASVDLLCSQQDNRALYRQSALHQLLKLRLACLSASPEQSPVTRSLLYLLEAERTWHFLASHDPRLFQEGRELALKLLVLRQPAHGHKARALESLTCLLLGRDPRRVAEQPADELGLAIFRELPQPYESWHPQSTLGLAKWAEERLSLLPGPYHPIAPVPVWGDAAPAV